MDLNEAVAGMTASACKITPIARHGDVVKQANFRGLPDPTYSSAVTAYFSERIGLAVVAVDALRGPRVTIDGCEDVWGSCPMGLAPAESY